MPAERTACSVTSVRTPEDCFGQQIHSPLLSAREAISAIRPASSVAERTNQTVTSLGARAERWSMTPGGRSGIVKPAGAPTRATRDSSRIPSFLASGVAEYPCGKGGDFGEPVTIQTSILLASWALTGGVPPQEPVGP